MSLRRKSCNACFKGRRKCNMAYPTCENCRKTKKNCRYAYPPVSLPSSEPHAEPDNRPAAPAIADRSLATLLDVADTAGLDFLESGAIPDFPDVLHQIQYPPLPHGSTSTPILPNASPSPSLPSIARFLGNLGEALPIQGSNQTWQWMIEELKSYPSRFARQGETIFIHRQLYRESMPQCVRTAFGISSSSCLLSDTNRDTLFQIIDTEVNELLRPAEPATLLDEVARLQALLLYQTIRLFRGTLEQRLIAEQQQGALMTEVLKLLARSQSQLANETADRHAWVLAECIRRTAIIVYMLYGVNSIFREGICVGLHTLAKLPLSTAMTSWNDTGGADGTEELAGTISYEDFTACWLVSPPRRLDPFEKLLIVPCRGIDAVEAYDSLALVEVEI
ncbi:hypothetical protein BDW66DRAFT_144603 [Aspergillus desertorum]